ncbi:hypothetical protein QWY31_09140 [Cytophagales bacterium LB-30]|uniref:Lipoprotein n=1 Tax=Shiella aurantiaca TaxID=3058365 RepID=A0ABT8F6R4_9BACT|nr:hypothetical protein [Shiella aurantiaca]MDN4165666.1 hypothetical protein [Shiella aurantiaca]
MLLKNLLKNSVYAGVALLTLAACNPQKKNGETAELSEADKELVDKIEKVVYEIPSPSEIPYLLENTGVEFDASLTHSTSKVNQYVVTNKAALNLGIYSTDIGYFSTYSKVQEALDYISKVKPLADQLGLSSAFDTKLMQRFEANLSSKDSLTSIINEAVKKADEHLKKNERNNVAAMILAGSFIEGLYIACALVENYPTDILPDDQRNLILVPLVRVILLQEKPLDDLIAMMKALEADPANEELLTSLEALSAEYKKLNIEENINNNRGDLLLKDETLDAITNKAGQIRDMITH